MTTSSKVATSQDLETPPEAHRQPPGSGAPEARPKILEYDPEKPIPPGYRLDSRPRYALLLPGLLVLGLSYGLTADFAASVGDSNPSSSNGTAWLYLPVLGPWITLFTMDRCQPRSRDSDECDARGWEEAIASVVLLASGGAQLVGAGLTIAGLTARTHQWVLTEHVQASIVPVPLGHSGHGLAVIGKFDYL